MPRRGQILDNIFYHVYNRGALKQNIFLDKFDYMRFLEILEEFNYQDSLDLNQIRMIKRCAGPLIDCDRGEKLIDLICFCLMPNHFHLLIRQKIEDGLVSFLRKISTGYAKYFNKKYDRSGVVFQGRFKSKKVESDAQLVHLSEYIHLNPLKVINKKNKNNPSEMLKDYRWSSYRYFADTLDSNLARPSLILKRTRGIDDYKKSLDAWAKRGLEIKKFL